MSSVPKFLLKTIGASDWPLDDNWIVARPELLKEVRTPKRPSGIGRGDLMVFYATGHQKVFAIARSKIDGGEAEYRATKEEARWPYVIPIQILLAIPQLPLAPDWGSMGISSETIMQKSYVEITRESYRRAWEAMVNRTSPETGGGIAP